MSNERRTLAYTVRQLVGIQEFYGGKSLNDNTVEVLTRQIAETRIQDFVGEDMVVRALMRIEPPPSRRGRHAIIMGKLLEPVITASEQHGFEIALRLHQISCVEYVRRHLTVVGNQEPEDSLFPDCNGPSLRVPVKTIEVVI